MTDLRFLGGGLIQRVRLAAAPRDKIFIRDLVLPCAIGVYAEEHGRTQQVGFTIEAEVAAAVQATADAISDVPSYDDMIVAVKSVIAEGHIQLVETLAERIAARILSDSRIVSVRIRIEKLEREPAAVGVEIVRPRTAIVSP